jgi:hypothetical protein
VMLCRTNDIATICTERPHEREGYVESNDKGGEAELNQMSNSLPLPCRGVSDN